MTGTMRAATAMIVPGMVLAGCAHAPRPAPAMSSDWRAIVTERDRARLRDWRQSWTLALANSTAGGSGARIAADRDLLAPDAALAHAAPPPGDYRCRVTKLGARVPATRTFAVVPAALCRIARAPNGLGFAKLDGAQRPRGFLYPAGDARMIFLGTMMLGDETMAMQYGRDAERDMVGAFERIGPNRWRLVLPAPRWESLLDVIELVPA